MFSEQLRGVLTGDWLKKLGDGTVLFEKGIHTYYDMYFMMCFLQKAGI